MTTPTPRTLNPAEARAMARHHGLEFVTMLERGEVVLPDLETSLAALRGGGEWRDAQWSAAPAAQPSVFQRLRHESDAQYGARVSAMLARTSGSERLARQSRSWEPPASARAEWPVAALGGTGRPPAGIDAVVAAMETPGFGIAPTAFTGADADLTLDQIADQVDQLCGPDGPSVVMPPQRQRAARHLPSPEARAVHRGMVADAVEAVLDAEPCA